MVSEGRSEYCGPHSASVWFLHLSIFPQITIEKKKKSVYLTKCGATSFEPAGLSLVFWEGYQRPPYPGHLQWGLVSSYFFCDLHHGQKQLGREKGLFHLILSGHPPSLREANLSNSSVEVPFSQVTDYRLYQTDKTNQLNGFLFILISRSGPYP